MKTKFNLTQDDFDALLAWLSEDREEAGKKYEEIRAGLVRFFSYRGCADPPSLADETINRVASKLSAFVSDGSVKPINFFYGFALNIYREYYSQTLKKEIQLEPNFPIRAKNAPPEDLGQEFECLEKCLGKLPEEDGRLVLDFYKMDKSAKFAWRRELAKNLNITHGALNTRIYRIRRLLRECVEKCLEK